ncbi:MAG: GDP-mannose 4,6-dehydratase [Lentisphaeria bacterium]|nr:GDP-mannose 4,6-dehydratase [Lentisphaeria bacterium]
MNERVLICGSNSFSGSHYAAYCLEHGMDVAGVSRSSELDPAFLPYKKVKGTKELVFRRFDLNRDLDQLMDFVMEFKPDYVVNFAAQGMVGESWNAPEQWLMTNTVSAVRFHDRLRKLPFLKKFVQISTPEVYGSCKDLVRENYSYDPNTPYAVSKAAADMSLMTFYRNYNFPVVFTRAANVFGPGQQLYRIVPIAIMKVLKGEKILLHGGGTSIRSFIHIRDVADGTFRVMTEGRPGEVYHFSTSRLISIKDLVKLILNRLGASFEDCVEAAPDRLGKDSIYQLSSEKARKELGWKDVITLEQGIDETIFWIKASFQRFKDNPCKYIHKE